MKVSLWWRFFLRGGCLLTATNMNKTYLWLAGMLLVGTVVGVAGAAYMAKSQAASSPAATS